MDDRGRPPAAAVAGTDPVEELTGRGRLVQPVPGLAHRALRLALLRVVRVRRRRERRKVLERGQRRRRRRLWKRDQSWRGRRRGGRRRRPRARCLLRGRRGRQGGEAADDVDQQVAEYAKEAYPSTLPVAGVLVGGGGREHLLVEGTPENETHKVGDEETDAGAECSATQRHPDGGGKEGHGFAEAIQHGDYGGGDMVLGAEYLVGDNRWKQEGAVKRKGSKTCVLKCRNT